MNVSNDRRGVFGGAKPAFSVSRFKRVLPLMLNEEMAAELLGILEANEKAVVDNGGQVARHLFELRKQIGEALYQPVPEQGTKPAVLAPGRPNPNFKAAS